MITIKFLTGWNAHLTSDPKKGIVLNGLQASAIQFDKVIEKALQYFDDRDYLYALFQTMSFAAASSFLATHDYCVKVLHCGHDATVSMNISPIYHLGVEYPQDYKSKYGKELDDEAVIGLLEKPAPAGTTIPGYTPFSYGVDAGILFKDHEIPCNKIMTLKLEEIREGVLVTLTCEKQTTSTTMSWQDIGLHHATALDAHRAQTMVTDQPR